MTIAPPAPVASIVMGAVHSTLGGVVSSTVIVKLQVAEFPAASVAVQVTVVVPKGKSEPEAGVQLTLGLETASLEVALR